MRSVKPGRGPSAMGAVGSIAVGIFGIVWILGAASMGAPSFFVLFGVVFVGLAFMQALFHFKNATSKNRMSLLDITDNNAEPDPLDRFYRETRQTDISHQNKANSVNSKDINFCPFCGNPIVDASHKFCAKCGEEIRK